ncbi:MAG: cation-translocating P-type ATPase [Bacteroides sp.]|nr:cation-translocating P-type ATPase [Eubacterium sp.]MCM1419408.1 cation-translocating P-type ATPase [Roseburia sp.]MCM1463236.1 cation-translocating P-type ATPase [Bacteroides sp.]
MNEVYEKTAREALAEAKSALGTSEEGLSERRVAENRRRFGENVIVGGKRKNALLIFLGQFRDFLVAILLLAAVVSAALGDFESFAVILAVLTMNAVLGTIQTIRAERSLESLKRLSAPTARVLRGGRVKTVAAEELVRGDLVLVEAGDRVSADGRIVEAAALRVNESALTGESAEVYKSIEPLSAATPLAERKNMVYAGSSVTGGRAKILITAVGGETEVGRIAALVRRAEERKTPLQRSLDQFGKKLSAAILLICAAVFAMSLFNVLRRGGAVDLAAVTDSFLFAVALAVAAIPEALSSIVTIVLSLGTRKMSAENAVVRDLRAVEGLGAVSVVCSDKTGTITGNRMIVGRAVAGATEADAGAVKDRYGEFYPLLRAAALCNDAETEEDGDPTETALLRFARESGLNVPRLRREERRIGEIPFDSERKRMSVLTERGDTRRLTVKGAAEVVVERTTLSAAEKRELLRTAERLAARGMRVLCFAEKEIAKGTISPGDESGLDYLGLTALADPPRPETRGAVADCRAAGIKPVMITGDHLATAVAVARETGILADPREAIEGRALDRLSDERLSELVETKSVYARVTPEHKLRIVKAWQSRGCIVAMTGDGVNDAPALRQADVGIAMGKAGTQVARDASAMILTDDCFATIVKAVKNGRNIYANIRKAILFLLSGNMAGILAVLFCSIAGLPVPFEPIHLLFINLLTDSLPAIALGLEPHTGAVMRERPRGADEPILTKKFLAETLWSGLILGAAAIGAYFLGLMTAVDAPNAAASTMAFATLCLSRLFHGFSCKSREPVLFSGRMFSNRWGVLAFAAGFVLLSAVLLLPPLSALFRVVPLSLPHTLSVYVLSLGSMLVIQMTKGFLFGEGDR